MTSREIAKWLKDVVKEISETDGDYTYHCRLDDDLAIYVGWEGGFAPDDEDVIHSKSNPEYCVCVKVAEWNPYCSLWDNVCMPWYLSDEEVYDTDMGISPNENFYKTALWLNKNYRSIRRLLKSGELTFGE